MCHVLSDRGRLWFSTISLFFLFQLSFHFFPFDFVLEHISRCFVRFFCLQYSLWVLNSPSLLSLLCHRIFICHFLIVIIRVKKYRRTRLWKLLITAHIYISIASCQNRIYTYFHRSLRVSGVDLRWPPDCRITWPFSCTCFACIGTRSVTEIDI